MIEDKIQKILSLVSDEERTDAIEHLAKSIGKDFDVALQMTYGLWLGDRDYVIVAKKWEEANEEAIGYNRHGEARYFFREREEWTPVESTAYATFYCEKGYSHTYDAVLGVWEERRK